MNGGIPVAACALERLGEHVRIVDLVAPRESWPLALRAIAAHVERAYQADAITCKLVRQDGARRALLRHGFLARETKPLNLMLPEGSRNEDILYDPARWFFTWADADLDFG
jgi:hypothetical protein